MFLLIKKSFLSLSLANIVVFNSQIIHVILLYDVTTSSFILISKKVVYVINLFLVIFKMTTSSQTLQTSIKIINAAFLEGNPSPISICYLFSPLPCKFIVMQYLCLYTSCFVLLLPNSYFLNHSFYRYIFLLQKCFKCCPLSIKNHLNQQLFL